MPRLTLMAIISPCVNVNRNESTKLSTFVATGNRHAALNQRQSFSSLPVPSIPAMTYSGAFSVASTVRCIHSGRKLSVMRYMASARR